MAEQQLANYVVEQFMSHISSSVSDSAASFSELTDPTYLDFLIIPHFEMSTGLFADEKNTNSALAYLKRIGELDRYEMLKLFIIKFKQIMSEGMWMFKSISGISDAMKRVSSEPLFIDQMLTFATWETVDWKMQSLMSLYKAIVYDFNDRFVEILPENLRIFWLSIYVRDIRILINDSDGKNARDFGRTAEHLDIDLTATNHRMFHFGHCEFTMNSATSQFDELSTLEQTEVELSLEMKYRTFNESAKFRTVLGDIKITSSAKNITQEDLSKPSIQELLSKRPESLSLDVAKTYATALAKFAKDKAKYELESANARAENILNAKAMGVLNNVGLRNIYTKIGLNTEFFNQADNKAVDQLRNVFNQL